MMGEEEDGGKGKEVEKGRDVGVTFVLCIVQICSKLYNLCKQRLA
jgi:hypothetical protein